MPTLGLSDVRPDDPGKALMRELTLRASRKSLINTLSRLLKEHFSFDRLCINLYDRQCEMRTYFAAAEGTVVHTLSPVRPADLSSTVAGRVIAERRPVIITDFTRYFPESDMHPIAEAGLTATMAFPLMLGNEIIATLHCSFAKTPENLYEITNVILDLCPAVAVCVGAVFSLEQLSRRDTPLRVQPEVSDETVICHSKAMREVMRKADAAAKLNVPVLLLGETGTGKSLLAQDIHRRSSRKSARFVKVNCPALPPTLFESELFGHVRGAFTGAAQKRAGRFELAHRGTLFLDEIGELAPEMQCKLLQAIEDAGFERVGESMPLAVDVRIIAATNINVGKALASGKLREDLFHRLALCVIKLPPLRERRDDIAPLVAALAAQIGQKTGLPSVKFTPALIAPLRGHAWPGNVRELRNIVTRVLMHAVLEKQVNVALIERVLEENGETTREEEAGIPPGRVAPSDPLVLRGLPALVEMERAHILRALEHSGGVIAGPNGAAVLLGIPRSTLQHRMRKLGIL